MKKLYSCSYDCPDCGTRVRLFGWLHRRAQDRTGDSSDAHHICHD